MVLMISTSSYSSFCFNASSNIPSISFVSHNKSSILTSTSFPSSPTCEELLLLENFSIGDLEGSRNLIGDLFNHFVFFGRQAWDHPWGSRTSFMYSNWWPFSRIESVLAYTFSITILHRVGWFIQPLLMTFLLELFSFIYFLLFFHCTGVQG